MKLTCLGSVIVTFALVAGPTLANSAGPLWWVSVPTLKIGQSERVVGFELKATDASIQSMTHIPRGWYISIANDA
jgi:hypothetical protein